MKFVALLRGINVGKSVQVPMKNLKELLVRNGLKAVTTYLNSGNVIFESDLSVPELNALLDAALTGEYGQKIPALIKTSSEMVEIEKAIPAEWGSNGNEQTYVAYLFEEADKPEIIDELPVKKEYMTLLYVKGAVIWNIKREHYNRSRITNIVGHWSYDYMTTRNVNTARKLAEYCRIL